MNIISALRNVLAPQYPDAAAVDQLTERAQRALRDLKGSYRISAEDARDAAAALAEGYRAMRALELCKAWIEQEYGRPLEQLIDIELRNGTDHKFSSMCSAVHEALTNELYERKPKE